MGAGVDAEPGPRRRDAGGTRSLGMARAGAMGVRGEGRILGGLGRPASGLPRVTTLSDPLGDGGDEGDG